MESNELRYRLNVYERMAIAALREYRCTTGFAFDEGMSDEFCGELSDAIAVMFDGNYLAPDLPAEMSDEIERSYAELFKRQGQVSDRDVLNELLRGNPLLLGRLALFAIGVIDSRTSARRQRERPLEGDIS
jgi:hypothetical protein